VSGVRKGSETVPLVCEGNLLWSTREAADQSVCNKLGKLQAYWCEHCIGWHLRRRKWYEDGQISAG